MTPRTPPYVNKPRESCSAGFVEKSVSTGTESSMTGKWEDLRLRIKNFRSLPKCEEMSCSALCPATCRRLCSRRVDGTSLRYVRSTAVSHMFSVGMMENGASDGRGTPRESPRFSFFEEIFCLLFFDSICCGEVRVGRRPQRRDVCTGTLHNGKHRTDHINQKASHDESQSDKDQD